MLVLQRRIGESICVGKDVVITVRAVRKGGVRLTIQAPDHVRVDRQEVRRRILAECDELAAGEPVSSIA